MIAINMILRGNESKKEEIIGVFSSLFDIVLTIKPEKEANEVFFLISKGGQPVNLTQLKKVNIVQDLHTLQKHLGAEFTKNMNVLEHLDNLKVLWPKEQLGAPEPKKQKKQKHKKH